MASSLQRTVSYILLMLGGLMSSGCSSQETVGKLEKRLVALEEKQ